MQNIVQEDIRSLFYGKLEHRIDDDILEFQGFLQGGSVSPKDQAIFNQEYDRKKAWNKVKTCANKDGIQILKGVVKIDEEKSLCPICGLSVDSKKITIEHMLPKSSYHQLILLPHNLLPACESCNSNRGSELVANPVNLYTDNIKVNIDELSISKSGDTDKDLVTYFDIKLNSTISDPKILDNYYVYKISQTYITRFYEEIKDIIQIAKRFIVKSGNEEIIFGLIKDKIKEKYLKYDTKTDDYKLFDKLANSIVLSDLYKIILEYC